MFYTQHGCKWPREPLRHPVKIHHRKNASQDDLHTPNSKFDARFSQSGLAFKAAHPNNQSTNTPLPVHYE
jgi:hypothetical protein